MFAMHLTAQQPAVFQLSELPTPRPGRGEVLIRMKAASLNFLDIAVANGGIAVPSLPVIPVCDGAGVIEALGEGVTGWAVGDRVVPHLMPGWTAGTQPTQHPIRGVNAPGSAAEFVVVPASSIGAIPAHLDFFEAATLPIAATTAWNALKAAQIRPGRSVLLQGTGGVNLFALQFARCLGAEVFVTSSDDRKLEQAQALGAKHLINYRRTPDWDHEVLRLTDGRGVDLVIETGGAETFERSLAAVAMAGTVFVIGLVTGPVVQFNVLPILFKTLRLIGNNTGSVEDFHDMLAAVRSSQIRPVIHRQFPLSALADAYQSHSAGGFGKTVINLEQPR